jgi:hypothetical protein
VSRNDTLAGGTRGRKPRSGCTATLSPKEENEITAPEPRATSASSWQLQSWSDAAVVLIYLRLEAPILVFPLRRMSPTSWQRCLPRQTFELFPSNPNRDRARLGSTKSARRTTSPRLAARPAKQSESKSVDVVCSDKLYRLSHTNGPRSAMRLDPSARAVSATAPGAATAGSHHDHLASPRHPVSANIPPSPASIYHGSPSPAALPASFSCSTSSTSSPSSSCTSWAAPAPTPS